MPSSPSLYIHGRPYLVSFRTEEGLPFVSLPLINEILWSCVARAQLLYNQELIGICIEPNHGHLLLRCQDPETVSSFVGYIKQEAAHAINRLVGRRKKTIWVAGSDKPVILDYKKFLDCFAYILLNPFKDQLVPDMKNYKGVCSFALFMDDKNVRPCRIISRSSVVVLNNPHTPWKESDEKLKELLKNNKKQGEVKFDFYSWKKCFPETAKLSDFEARQLMLEELEKFKTEAIKNKKPKTYFADLSKQSLLKIYTPKKFGKKMICLSYFKELRVDFIDYFKDKVRKAKAVFQSWKQGDLSKKYPVGMFAPHVPRLVNLVPALVPV